jgi:beta-galactosidase/beta-glucuronidase
MHGYPRPQLARAQWTSLNGPWEFALDSHSRWDQPGDVAWDATINVPFAPETSASGIGDTSFYEACWYRLHLETPALLRRERLVLHFGAVDYATSVWLDNALVGSHEGGYTPFAFDLTEFMAGQPTHELVVRAQDDPRDLAKPRGKQDWEREPHAIWYPRTTGIWQTVWTERVGSTRLETVRWTPSLDRWDVGLHAGVAGIERDDLRLEVTLRVGERTIARDVYSVTAGEVHRRIGLSDPGVDDFRNGLLWSPASPTLVSARLRLWGQDDEQLDDVRSYFGFRAVAVQGDRVVLNGRPYPLRMVLDQGYWPETGATPPSDDALRRDVELAKSMGFNGVRKHQKIEDPRYLYWADRLGLLVWEEMPSAYRFTKRSVQRVTREWMRAIDRDFSHPCVMAWVPFNESWGVPNLPDSPAERHYVEALYHLTKTLDPTRPVIGNDGWESVATDIIGVHDYEPPERMARRYRTDDVRPHLFRRERPGGRLLVLGGTAPPHPVVLSEFGGLALCRPEQSGWGYRRCETAEELETAYARLMEVVHAMELIAGFCYTQFADTYQEANGLLYADRAPKFALQSIARATRGPRSNLDLMAEPPKPDSGPEP